MFTKRTYSLGGIALISLAAMVGCGGADPAPKQTEKTGQDGAAITALGINPVGCDGNAGTATALFDISSQKEFLSQIAIDQSDLRNTQLQLSLVDDFGKTIALNIAANIASSEQQAMFDSYTKFTNAAKTYSTQIAKSEASQYAKTEAEQFQDSKSKTVAEHFSASTVDTWQKSSNSSQLVNVATGLAVADNHAHADAFNSQSASGFQSAGVGALGFANFGSSATAFSNQNADNFAKQFFTNVQVANASNQAFNATHNSAQNYSRDVVDVSNTNFLRTSTESNVRANSLIANIANAATLNEATAKNHVDQSASQETTQFTKVFNDLTTLQAHHMLLKVDMTAFQKRTDQLLRVFANTNSQISSADFSVSTPTCW
jgi:hypothetical protein